MKFHGHKLYRGRFWLRIRKNLLEKQPIYSGLNGGPKTYVHILIHRNCIFGEKAFTDLIKAEMRSAWIIQVSPKSKDKCPCKRRTEERWPCEDGGGDWSDEAASQGMPGAISGCGEARKHSP